MKKITLDEVIRHLQDTVSMEIDPDGKAVYYLHITEDGDLMSDYIKADETFTAILDSVAYESREDDWREDVEVADNPHFLKVAQSLADKANEWLESLGD